jgi:hypothetical protein
MSLWVRALNLVSGSSHGMGCEYTPRYDIYRLLTTSRDAKPIGDESGRVIAVLVGRPRGETEKTWGALHDEGLRVIEEARKQCSFSHKQASHRRGNFGALAEGPSFGGGQKVFSFL